MRLLLPLLLSIACGAPDDSPAPTPATLPLIGDDCRQAIEASGGGAIATCVEGLHLGCCSGRWGTDLACGAAVRDAWFECSGPCGTSCFPAAGGRPAPRGGF